MKNMQKLMALILAVLLMSGATGALAGTYTSDAVSPSISNSSTGAPQQGDATAAPGAEATPAPEANPEATPVPAEIEAVVTTENDNGSVNIRAAASADSEIIGQLTSGMSVKVLGITGDWVHVRAGDIDGYVFGKYLSIPEQTEPEATPVPEETPIPEVTPVPEATPAVQQQIILSANRDVTTLQPGDILTLSARLIGFEGVSYTLQWQAQYPDGSWQDIPGANDTTLTIPITEEHNGCSWRLQANTGE